MTLSLPVRQSNEAVRTKAERGNLIATDAAAHLDQMWRRRENDDNGYPETVRLDCGGDYIAASITAGAEPSRSPLA